MSARSEFLAALKPHIPTGWAAYHYSPQLENVGKVTLAMQQRVVRRRPSAPQGADEAQLTLTVISPVTDPQNGEDALEDALDATLDALDQLKNILIGDATRKVFAEKFPCYDIEIEVPTTRKKTP